MHYTNIQILAHTVRNHVHIYIYPASLTLLSMSRLIPGVVCGQRSAVQTRFISRRRTELTFQKPHEAVANSRLPFCTRACSCLATKNNESFPELVRTRKPRSYPLPGKGPRPRCQDTTMHVRCYSPVGLVVALKTRQASCFQPLVSEYASVRWR